MSEQQITEAHDRLAEFSRQARLKQDTDPAVFYTVWTDAKAEMVTLSLDDLDLVLDGLRKARGLSAPWSL